MNRVRRVLSRRRRWIPFTVSFVVFMACMVPFYTDWVAPRTADVWTMPIASLVFAFMAFMFAWIRHRIVTDERTITMFGMAIHDFFVAHILMGVVWSVVYAIIFAVAVTGSPPTQKGQTSYSQTPTLIRTVNRAAIISGGVLIVGTGLAFGYEMRRAGSPLAVHEPKKPWSPASDPDRRSGKERRSDWPSPMSPG